MKNIYGIAIIIICFCIGVSFAHADNVASTKDDEFRSLLSEAAQSDDIVGLAVAVVRNGEVTFSETYGYRELEGDDPVDRSTVFRIASLSKGFAASAAGQLIADGKLSLSAGVSDYVPELRLKNGNQLKALTLENVLSHRTSLPPYAYDNLLEAGVAPAEILGEFRKVDPICPVGQCYSYQNVAFDTISRVIEQTDGRAYSDVVEEEFFNKLDMGRASFGLENLKQDDNWARPHRRRRGQAWRVGDVKEAYYRVPAAGGVNASIVDMAEWLKAQMGYAPDVISPQILEMTHTERVRTPAEIRRLSSVMKLDAAHYGLGWRIYEYAGTRVVKHSGSVDGGYGAQIAFLPDRGVGIVLLTNSRSRQFWEILPAFLDAELNDRADLAD